MYVVYTKQELLKYMNESLTVQPHALLFLPFFVRNIKLNLAPPPIYFYNVDYDDDEMLAKMLNKQVNSVTFTTHRSNLCGDYIYPGHYKLYWYTENILYNSAEKLASSF